MSLPLSEKQPWDVTLETCGQKRLAALMKALIITHSQMTCSFYLGYGNKNLLKPSYSVHFRIFVHIGNESEFENISGCRLKPIPTIRVGTCKPVPYLYKGEFYEKRWAKNKTA